ncbi:MAG: hypothetical protein KKA81_15540 [Bacteroidetes bacterium]|nr:hypothetical protein [Bacteroidota bacterium]
MKRKMSKQAKKSPIRIRTVAVLSPPTLEQILGGSPQYGYSGLPETGESMNKTLTFFCCRRRWE